MKSNVRHIVVRRFYRDAGGCDGGMRCTRCAQAPLLQLKRRR